MLNIPNNNTCYPRLLQEDADHAMFTVTLFNKVIDEYKHHCRENKFMVRDFVYNEEELKQGKEEISKLSSDKKKQFVSGVGSVVIYFLLADFLGVLF